MRCPQCNHEQTCPCPSCQERNPTEKPWVWVTEESIACGNCGLHRSADYWLELDYNEYKEDYNDKELDRISPTKW